MRRGAMCAALLTGLALAMCPVAQAEPTADDWYTKALSGNGVNYQDRVSLEELISEAQMICAALDKSPGNSTYQAAVDSIVAKGVFTPEEADGIGSSAIAAYCPDHNGSLYD